MNYQEIKSYQKTRGQGIVEPIRDNDYFKQDCMIFCSKCMGRRKIDVSDAFETTLICVWCLWSIYKKQKKNLEF